MPDQEIPKLIVSSGAHIMSRGITAEVDEDDTRDAWQISSPIPGNQIVNTWQIYKNIWIILARSDAGKYNIYRSINLREYTLVHQHDTEILNIFWITDGQAVFSARDGWWIGKKSGLTWTEVSFLTPIQAKAMAVIPLDGIGWAWVAYATDHKIYYCEYPGGDWEEAYDAANVLELWYPAIAGSAAGILAGAGKGLIRSLDRGAPGTWVRISTAPGIIKDIVASNRSNKPVFLLTIKSEEGSDVEKLFWSYDLGDSIEQEISRAEAIIGVQSVIPTGNADIETQFAVLGKRTAGQIPTMKLLSGG